MPDESKPILETDLRDKPVGYPVGNKGRAILKVSECPVCKKHGIPQGPRHFLHVLRFYDFYGEAKLSMQGACELPAPSVAARVAKRKL